MAPIAAFATVVVVLVSWAFWTAGVDSDANGAGGASSVQQGATPSADAVGDTVTVTWAASTLTSGEAVDGYQVARYDSATLDLQTIGSACTGTIAALSCTESAVPAGSWKYAVTPVFADNWLGAESAKSATVTVVPPDTTAPTNALTLNVVSGNAALVGTTVYYRGTASGSFTVTNAVSDADSGPASSETAALGGTTTGWTHTPSTVSTPSGGPYVSDAFSWTAGTTSGPTEVVTGRDVAGNSAESALTFGDDSTPPSDGTLSYTNGYQPGLSVPVTFTTGTDGGSGIATRQLQRQSSPLTAGTCGTWSGYTNLGPANPTSTYTDNAVANATCYQYQYVVTDLAGNVRTTTSASVSKVDYAGAVDATTGALSHWRLGEASESSAPTVSDTLDDTNGVLLTSHNTTGQTGATWTYWYGGNNETFNDNRITSTDGGRAIYTASGVPPTADYAVEADIYYKAALTGDMTGVIGRFANSGTTPTFYMARYEVADQSWNIVKYSGTTASYPTGSYVTGQSFNVGETKRVRLEMSGTTNTSLRLYVNGVLTVSIVDSTSPYTAPGLAGIMEGNNGSGTVKSTAAGFHLDNFKALPLRAADSKGSNHAAYGGAVTRGSAGALVGDMDAAATFDGTNDFVQAVNTTSFPVLASARSTELWFKTSYTGGQALFAYGSRADTEAYGLWLNASSASMTAWGFGAGHDKTFNLASSVTDGQWHHLVKTYDGTTLTLYVDGAALPTQAATRSTVMGTTGFGIGAVLVPGDANTGKFFTGSLDEVSFYTSVLSQADVTNHYELGTSTTGADVSGPTGGSVDASGLVGTGSRYATSTTLSLDLAKGTDPSGVATTGATLSRATGTLSSGGTADGTCTGFGGYTLVSGGTDPASPKTDTVTDQACYRYQYVVHDTLGNATTYTSGDIKVDLTAPAAPALSFGTFTNAYWSSGGTVYYRSEAASGSFTATSTASDAGSGIASHTFPALGTNWTSTPGALGVNTYSWSGAPAAPGAQTITATNHATGVSPASASFTPTADDTAPSDGTVTYPDTTQESTSISVDFTTGTDTGSGIASRLLQRASATLTDTTCGTYSGFTTITGGTDPGTSPVSDTVTTGSCYQYQYVVTDQVGNAHTATSANVVKVTSGTTYYDAVWAESSLLNYYRMNEPSGTAIDDIEVANNDGTYFGSPTMSQAGAISGNNSVLFDGVDDYGSIARQISGNFSIEFWFKSTQGIGTDPRWTQGASLVDNNISGSNNDFGVSLRSDGRVVAGVGGGANGDTSIVSSTSGFNDGSWHHVAFTRTQSSGVFILYVDGASQGTETNNTNALTAQANITFGRAASGGNFYQGNLDEIAIYNSVLSAATVEAHFLAR